MDFFSGSATTVEAVMSLNASDGGNRKIISIQLPEDLDNKYNLASQGDKAKIKKVIDFLDSVNRPHTLDQIGMERIVRAANKIREKYPDTTVDLGFRHYSLSEPSKDTLDKLEKFTPEDNQTMFIKNNVYESFGKSTVLTTWLVRDGYGFTAPVKEINFNGYKGYCMDKHLYLIDPVLSAEVIEAIVVKYDTDGSFNPENVVLFGYNFTWTELDSLQLNLKRLKDTEKNLRINFDVRY